ncbi:hypothetical protein DHW03_17105 [Pedobacter yonginense]|uniref:Uncharacterized protein n=1 Tax=Pedobacter yonginense TaxID=651869 RepID=A0A317EMJ0_9SPHI|nr:hypothetical protein DHW03_17105 [Pedobacter yonginense]
MFSKQVNGKNYLGVPQAAQGSGYPLNLFFKALRLLLNLRFLLEALKKRIPLLSLTQNRQIQGWLI